MKGIIFYYSGSGNTRLACQYIAKRLPKVEFEFASMVKSTETRDLHAFDIVGFATFTDFVGPPQLIYDFFQKMSRQDNVPAFVFVTYGTFPGRTLKALASLVESKGFEVIAGHQLKTPESYPPVIVRGLSDVNAPNMREMAKLDEFIEDLNESINQFMNGNGFRKKKLKLGVLNSLIPVMQRTRSKKVMGEKFVDTALCTKCGTCEKGCPYGAITLSPFPSFDMTKCFGCWYCYNHCPKRAIYTKKLRNIGHYPKPNEQLEKKLKI